MYPAALYNPAFDPRIPSLVKQAVDENNGIEALFNRADEARMQAATPRQYPQMSQPSALMFGVAALMNAMDRRNQPGGGLLQGYMQGSQYRQQNTLQQQQAEAQRLMDQGNLYENQAQRKLEAQRYRAALAHQKSLEEAQNPPAGDDSQTPVIGAGKANQDPADPRAEAISWQIASSLARTNDASHARWLAVLNNPNLPYEARLAAYSKLQRLKPDLYANLMPAEIVAAVQSSKPVQESVRQKVLTDQRRRARVDGWISAQAKRAGLDDVSTQLLKKEMEHYDDTVATNAADMHSRILFRKQRLRSPVTSATPTSANAAAARQKSAHPSVLSNASSEFGTLKAIAALEAENYNAILDKHGGQLSAEDGDDYDKLILSSQRYQSAMARIKSLEALNQSHSRSVTRR